ncbi:MAG: hypothetical protein ACYTEZ_00285 [Planctomycetota bacterium]|jgi:hypothetical protein
MRKTVLLLVLVAAARAEPPESRHYVRMDDLHLRLADRQAELRAQEEFAKKSREEKILISFDRGDKKFEKLRLSGESVVKTILDWSEVEKDSPTEETLRVLEELGNVLEKKYARVVDIPKRERHRASLPLVEALTDKRFHVRHAAIEALKKIYRTPNGHFYQPDADPKQRKEKQKVWKRFVDREFRR